MSLTLLIQYLLDQNDIYLLLNLAPKAIYLFIEHFVYICAR